MKAPQRIWLQVPDDWNGEMDEDFTWCIDKINDTDICYVRAGKSAHAQRSEPEIVTEDLIKELELLKSYFEDRMEVVLHRNDIKWKTIDACIAAYREAEGK